MSDFDDDACCPSCGGFFLTPRGACRNCGHQVHEDPGPRVEDPADLVEELAAEDAAAAPAGIAAMLRLCGVGRDVPDAELEAIAHRAVETMAALTRGYDTEPRQGTASPLYRVSAYVEMPCRGCLTTWRAQVRVGALDGPPDLYGAVLDAARRLHRPDTLLAALLAIGGEGASVAVDVLPVRLCASSEAGTGCAREAGRLTSARGPLTEGGDGARTLAFLKLLGRG